MISKIVKSMVIHHGGGSEKRGLSRVRGGGRRPSVVCLSVCLSVTMRTSPSPADRSGRNFQGRTGPTPPTFISGISPIGQGTGEKRAGNSNIVFFIVYENDCFGQDNDFVWLPGAAL